MKSEEQIQREWDEQDSYQESCPHEDTDLVDSGYDQDYSNASAVRYEIHKCTRCGKRIKSGGVS